MVLEVKAPANVKIAGEHSVVHGWSSLSAAIDKYATATIEENHSNKLEIVLRDLKLSGSFDGNTLRDLYEEYGKRDANNASDLIRYIEGHNEIDRNLLPYATIASRLLEEFGISPLGKRITIHSDIPIQKGYASSAACSTAFAIAVMKASGRSLDDDTSIDVARDGERIIHRSEGAGRIDVGPAYYGGYVRVSREGIRRESVDNKIDLIVIDTDPKPPTSEMVGKVRKKYASDKDGTTRIFNEIEECVIGWIEALEAGNLEEAGRNMSRNHELLKGLGLSSEGLDKAMSIAIVNGAAGAKLCGGGGGGIGIALAKNDSDAKRVVGALRKGGFGADSINITFFGAKDSSESRKTVKA